MQNRTDIHDDEFVATKPADVTAEQWAAIKRNTVRELERLVQEASGRCAARSWCTMGGSADHSEFHASDSLDLAGVDVRAPRDESGAPTSGWWCLAVQNQGDGQPVGLSFEGRLTAGAPVDAFQLDARIVAGVLRATGTEEARAALWGLLERLGEQP